MKTLASLVTTAALALLLHAAPTPADSEKPQVSTTALKGPLHMLQGRGGNVVASVGQDGILLVDDDYAEYAPAYREALDALGKSGTEPRIVLNTHWHGDHTGSNGFWGQRGALLMAHDNVRRRMSTRQEMKAFDRVVEPSPPEALPVVTYGDSLVVHFNGDDVEVQHYANAHTDGDSVVYYARENVVHMGDLYFKDRFPFVDLHSGGNVFGYIAAVEAVLARVDEDTVIVPGHGSLANRADLKGYLDMLTRTSTSVKAALEGGASADEIIEKGLGAEWESYGSGFINEESWIRFIAGSI
jgi:glyoxylase-like metal-dependent hydrolase (beta-lactamase superfamily II)